MFSKRPAPVIGKLTNPFMSGGTWDASPSPRSPLECKIISPRGPINCDLSGVGLGIVAAMEKYSNDKSQVLANKSSTRSDLDPVNPSRILSSKEEDTENKEEDRLEDYTLVTRNRPDNMRSTRLYYDWSDQIQKKDSDRRRSKWNQTGFVDFPNISADDFLSNCDMCKKKLHGKDIYMYRGEKGFCSPECRYKQILIDEKKEKYRSDESTSTSTSRSVEVSDSFCQNGRILFTPEILAI